ncbi:MAG: hypothetical protein JNK73_05935, partial [Bacteroidia bacterium]|nr:hypothetical protein [Bacteroidia bacterium]
MNLHYSFFSKTFTSRLGLFILFGLCMLTSKAQFVTYTFTSAGASGSVGPTQAQVNAAYLATNLNGAVVSVGGKQTWTVPSSGLYHIDISGAQGGSAPSYNYTGGLGARMQGQFNLVAGQVLTILVGQAGVNGCGDGGGGGGTYVVVNGTLLIAAGGGGGCTSQINGVNATTLTSGTQDNPAVSAAGTGGNGGGACTSGSHNGGGGGGYNAAAAGNGVNGGGGGGGGQSFLNGGLGGTAFFNSQAGPAGGFGGGGGGSYCTVGGGGGGGYSGGAGGQHLNQCISNSFRTGGGGGGSFNSAVSQTNTPGFQSGNGRAILTRLCNITLTAAGTNSNGAICAGQSVTITTDAISNYTWSTGSNASSITDSPTITTTYSLTAMSPSNCMTSAAITVTVDPAVPNLTVANTATAASGVCPNSTVVLTASGATSYSWTGGVSNGVVFTPTTAASYTVTGYNACGTTTAVTSVSVHPLPPVTAVISQPSVCTGNTVVTLASGAV